jgi:hypothetical protein
MSLAGRLEDLALSDIFQILSVGRKTGTFIVSGSKGTAVIVFKKGLIVRAETDDLDKNLGQNLVDMGLVKETVFNISVSVKKELPGKSIAEILHELGSVSRDIIEKVARKRIERVIYRLLLWDTGDFRFELDDVAVGDKTVLSDLGWELSKGLSPEYLLMEGARVYDEASQPFSLSTEEILIDDSDGISGWDEDWSADEPGEKKDLGPLKSLTQELRFPSSASEITLLILRFASDIFQRGVIFMVGKHEMIGLGQFGLEIEKADEKVRELVLKLEESDFLRKIMIEQMTYKGALEDDGVTEYMVHELGGVKPVEAAFFPIVAEGQVVAMLYCDNVASKNTIGDTEGLEIFISHAGLALEKSLLQRRLQNMEQQRRADR